jgi:fatty-acyl-CoA synthase
VTTPDGLPATLAECLLRTAERGEGEYVFHHPEGRVRMSCEELAERALRGARRLAAQGVGPGDRIGIFGPNRPEWVVAAFATWLAGGAVVPTPKPLRVRAGHLLAEATARLMEMADCRRVLVHPELTSLVPEGLALPWDSDGDESSEPPPLPSGESAAVIQPTSGSTATPKGALVTHEATMAQLQFLGRRLWQGDTGLRTSLNWTPYFHDLGLFLNGVISSAVWGVTTHQLPTELFARDPALWFRLLESTGATMTVAPSSAYGAALRATARRGERIDLRHVEVLLFGAESVDPGVAERMADASAGVRCRPEALGSSYGLAEAVLAVTIQPPGTGLWLDRLSLEALGELRAEPAGDGPARVLASCGRPGDQVELRIMGQEGTLPERHVGELQLRGPSLMRRYVGAGALDPFADGWLRTGDLGYLADGDLFIAGRLKDMVIVLGQNYYPEDFEWAAGGLEGVRPGRCVAFGDDMSERLVLLVEPSAECDFRALARAVRERVADAVGVMPNEVAVVPRGTIEKTSSGKLRRGFMRAAYSEGSVELLGRSGSR